MFLLLLALQLHVCETIDIVLQLCEALSSFSLFLFPTVIITFKYVDSFISCVLSTDKHDEDFFTSDMVYVIFNNSISLFLISFIF